MALVSLAVVGRENEPLYLRDFHRAEGPAVTAGGSNAPGGREDSTDVGDGADDDPFGFFSDRTRAGGGGEGCSLRHQVREFRSSIAVWLDTHIDGWLMRFPFAILNIYTSSHEVRRPVH